MIYWWLFNVWVGIMCLAEFAKADGMFVGAPMWIQVWMGIATFGASIMLIGSIREMKK